jgi:hypothetical protein
MGALLVKAPVDAILVWLVVASRGSPWLSAPAGSCRPSRWPIRRWREPPAGLGPVRRDGAAAQDRTFMTAIFAVGCGPGGPRLLVRLLGHRLEGAGHPENMTGLLWAASRRDRDRLHVVGRAVAARARDRSLTVLVVGAGRRCCAGRHPGLRAAAVAAVAAADPARPELRRHLPGGSPTGRAAEPAGQPDGGPDPEFGAVGGGADRAGDGLAAGPLYDALWGEGLSGHDGDGGGRAVAAFSCRGGES